MRILVAGGTGFIGSALVQALRTHGHEVMVLSRRESTPNSRDYAWLSEPLEERFDAVVNLAGESVVGLWTPAKKRRILESRVRITMELVDWMRRLPQRPQVFFSASAVGIYGNRPGESLSEESRLDPEQRFR